MLSEYDIEDLIKPFEERQRELEEYVIKIISERVNEIGHMLPSDIYKLQRLYETGSDVKKINKAISRMTGIQEKKLKELIKQVALDAYIDVKPYYDYRHKPFIPLSENNPLIKMVEAISRQTRKELKNLSNTSMIGFLIRDRKHPKKFKFYDAADTYRTVIDEAIQAAQSGVIDYGTAMRRTLKQLNNSGMRRIYYESGYSQRMDTAVKRNILDGIRQVSQGVRIITGEQFGADGVELTAHAYPAPDHAPFQGHQFRNSEWEALQNNKPFKDVDGNKFPAQERIIGQWNCRHMAYPIIVGVTKPTYSKKELSDILRRNEKGVTLSDGTHLTGYEVLQKQNEIAVKVRRAKDGQIMAREAGDEELAKQYQRSVNKYTKQYNAFNKMYASKLGISERRDKMTVSGYRKISVK